jgi:predicted secreted Zn-dependent protease
MKVKKRIQKRPVSSPEKPRHRKKRSENRPANGGRQQAITMAPGAALSAGNLLQLQRTVGNRAAARLVSTYASNQNALFRQAAGDEPMLRYGSQSESVKMLQHYLVQAGANIDVDGMFGPITHQAVVAYQKSNGLDVDGIVGPNTWASLKTGGGTVDADETGQGTFGQSDLADQIGAKLKAIAVTLRSLSTDSPAPATEPQMSLSQLIEPVTENPGKVEVLTNGQTRSATQARAGEMVMKQPDEDVQETSGTDAGEVSDLPVADLMEAVSEVNSAVVGLSAEAQSGLGPAIETLNNVAESVGIDPASTLNHTTLSDLDSVLADAQVFAANQGGAATNTGFTKIKVDKDETYKFNPNTIAGAGQELDNHMAIHGEAGHVGPLDKNQPVIKFQLDAKSKLVVEATFSLMLERELPEWTNVKDVGKKCPCWKAEWDRFDKAIKIHEQQHVNIYKKLLAGLHAKCIGKTETEAGNIIDAVMADVEVKQAEFDTKTQNGQIATPSTKFNAGKSCKSC